MSSLRISALEDLASQLRFAPKERILEQIRRVEEVASLIDPAHDYPEDWFIFRVTGYRPELESPAIFAGDALLGDLSSFTERLTSGASMSLADLGEGALTLGELEAKWGVSGKTISRLRRRGLIACRVVDEAGGRKLAFRRSAIEVFESRPDAQIRRAPAMTRIRPEERARIFRMALRASRRFGWSMNETASRLAPRVGQGHETIRNLLQQEDLRADAQAFAGAGPLTPRQRQFAFRAVQWGIEPAVIARRLGRSRATVHRVVNERRAALLRSENLSTGLEEAVSRMQTPDDALHHPVASEELILRPIEDCAALRAAVDITPAPNIVIERTLGVAHAVLMTRSIHGVRELSRAAPSATALDRIETDLRWAALLRGKLLESQWRLVVSAIEGRIGGVIEDLSARAFERVFLACVDAMSRATTEFDPFEGGRLAAPSGLALNRVLARMAPGIELPEGRARPAATARRLPDWRRRLADWQQWLEPDRRLERAAADLGEPGCSIIRTRYAFDGHPPRTLAELEEMFGLTRAAIVEMERSALRIMRTRVEQTPDRPSR